MSLRYIFLAGASAAAIGTASVSARATPQTFIANQWYTAGFGTSDGLNASAGNALGAVGIQFLGTGTNGPILPAGTFQTSASLSTSTTWTIIAPYGGYLTIVDLESSGDQFQMTDNGVFMSATSGALGGQTALANGVTSMPTSGDSTASEDIASALGNEHYSSGTFALLPGENAISGILFATTPNAAAGDVNFIFELNGPPPSTDAPEPTALSVLGVALVGLGTARRLRKARSTIA